MRLSKFIYLTLHLIFLSTASSRILHASTNSTDRAGGYQFDRTISRPVLENYLARSICIEGMLNGRGPLADDIRIITNSGAKYIGRALCLWGAERNFLADIKRAKEQAPQVLTADPE